MATDTATFNRENQSKNHLFYHQKEASYVQSLSVNINIPVPSDSVIITKIELQELKKLQLAGVYWSMKDLEKRVNRKSEWIKENIRLFANYSDFIEKFVVSLFKRLKTDKGMSSIARLAFSPCYRY